MSEYAPRLEKHRVAPEKLVLDPNNPRLITCDEDLFGETQALDLLDQTFSRMRDQTEVKGNRPRGKSGDRYKIHELESSISENGWWPIDFIFVKKFDNDGRYLVLEGNRRVTAIRNLRNSETTSAELKASLDLIDVMEIIGETDETQLKKKITYLLGVRHHGSLKKWTPFAQAHNIYKSYLDLAKIDGASFRWETTIAQEIANALSIDETDVRERTQVYRVMEQLGNTATIQNSEGGIVDRYYSVIAEVLLTKTRELREYIRQNEASFLLDDNSVSRIINLCNFDKKNREGAPINNPQEWRKLANILKENDLARREEMLAEVEIAKRRPSDVWAERATELKKVTWDKWLSKVDKIIRTINIGQVDIDNEDAHAVASRLFALLAKLDAKDAQ